jgi:hypothetical protein
MKQAKGASNPRITSKENLLKVHFSLVLFLALSTVVDLHVKLRRTTVVVEKHEKPLMQVMVLRKLGPAAPEVHLAAPIIVHFHFIGSSSSRLLKENYFTKLTPIHELGEFQRNTLYFMALSASDTEERESLDRSRRRGIAGSSTGTWSGSSRYLGPIFAPHRAARVPLHRCGQRSHQEGILQFFLTTARMAASPSLHQHTGAKVDITSICHREATLSGKEKP